MISSKGSVDFSSRAHGICLSCFCGKIDASVWDLLQYTVIPQPVCFGSVDKTQHRAYYAIPPARKQRGRREYCWLVCWTLETLPVKVIHFGSEINISMNLRVRVVNGQLHEIHGKERRCGWPGSGVVGFFSSTLPQRHVYGRRSSSSSNFVRIRCVSFYASGIL